MNILLPIETINREIDFKIALAGFLSGKGHKVYIGQHEFLMKFVPKMKEGGLYVGKNIFNKRANIENGEKYYLLKKHNFNIVYLHEEGAVFPGDQEYWTTIIKSQYNLDFFDSKDSVCVWGNFQKKVDTERTSKVPIYVTGHPRFDLCKKEWHSFYQSKVDALHQNYKDFILINGNYTISNHGLGNQHVFSEKGDYNVTDEKERMKRVNFYCHFSKQLAAMVQLTHQLAVTYSDLNFVYRPHPSENHAYYKTIFKGVKNIIVSHEGPILPWILASKMIIHDGCTTAIEASLAGKPVLNFKAYPNDDFDIWLPNQMGIKSNTVDGVIAYINEITKTNFDFQLNNNNDKVSEFLYNFKDNSFEALLEVINKSIQKTGIIKNSTISKFNLFRFYSEESIKKILYRIMKPNKRAAVSYHNTKFYGFKKDTIFEKVENFEKILNKKIKVKFHNTHLVEIE